MALLALDNWLIRTKSHTGLSGFRRFLVEFGYFGLKEARACLFAGLFFAAVFLVPRAGVAGVPRYDLLLLIALLIQGWLVLAKLETLG